MNTRWKPFIDAGPLTVGDIVRTPSGREAEVKRAWAGGVLLRYTDDGEGVQLNANLLTFLRHGGDHGGK